MWYANGKAYSSEEREFEELPRDGALVLVLQENRSNGSGQPNKSIYQGYDYYFKADGPMGPIYACDLDSRERPTMLDIQERYENPVIIRGKWTDRAMLELALEEARNWLR